MKIYKIALLFFITLSVMSCKEEDSRVQVTSDLIGEWQRSDVTTEFDYRLVFNSQNVGHRSIMEGNEGGPATSSAVTFEWDTEEDILTMDYDDEMVITTFLINEDGQLLLPEITDLYFSKL